MTSSRSVGVRGWWWLCGFVVLCGGVCGDVQETELILDRIVSAIDGGLKFLMEEHRALNLDAIIGTRLVEGQTAVLLEHLNSGEFVLPAEFLARIENIKGLAAEISQEAIPYTRAAQPHYFNRIGAVLQHGFWTLDYESRDVDRSLMLEERQDRETMKEEWSDDCLTELFGTSDSGDTSLCHVTSGCWEMMTSPGNTLYSLSHQVFYLQIAQQFGCLTGSLLNYTNHLNAGFCANMLQDADIISANDYPERRRDVFMEIPALCGVLGYRQFFQSEWLQQILSWQKPQGCWGKMEKKPIMKSALFHARVRREEKFFGNGCGTHRTAVALGALTQYLRYVIEVLKVETLPSHPPPPPSPPQHPPPHAPTGGANMH